MSAHNKAPLTPKVVYVHSPFLKHALTRLKWATESIPTVNRPGIFPSGGSVQMSSHVWCQKCTGKHGSKHWKATWEAAWKLVVQLPVDARFSGFYLKAYKLKCSRAAWMETEDVVFWQNGRIRWSDGSYITCHHGKRAANSRVNPNVALPTSHHCRFEAGADKHPTLLQDHLIWKWMHLILIPTN